MIFYLKLGYKIFSLEKLDIYTNLKSSHTQICILIAQNNMRPRYLRNLASRVVYI